MSTTKQFYVVGIGASAGGLEAIESFFSNIPLDSGLAFVIVQHLSPDYKSLMPEILLKRTSLPIHTAEDGMQVEPNNVYLIPRRMNMKIFHAKLHLTEKNNMHILNLPIDIFLHSLAEDFEDKSIGVILSGTGSDGSRGIRVIKENGGMIIAQDPDSTKFDGMPKSAITTGTVDYILPPQDMPEKIINYVKHPYIKDKDRVSSVAFIPEDYLTKIIMLLKEQFLLDFTFYKDATISRRIERRLSINQISSLKEYLDYLYSSKNEQKILYKELLIGVTKFFRDTEAFTIAEKEIIPAIFKDKHENEEVRVWISPCSTGEEAYSIAILIKEFMLNNNMRRQVKIFATDVDKSAIDLASMGIYNQSISADVTPERLNKFFIQTGDSYKINDEIREMIVFATHNIIKDPPFNKIDLISCRNLLIYFQTSLQQKVLSLFSFALNKNGYLFLGSSESIGEMEHYYEIVNLKWKFFKSKESSKLPLDIIAPSASYRLSSQLIQSKRPVYGGRNTIIDLTSIFTEKLLADNVPDTVIVNENYEIVNSFGDPNRYLVFPKTKKIAEGFEYLVTKMVPANLKLTFSISISKVIKTDKELVHHNIKYGKEDGDTILLDLRFAPLLHKDSNTKFVVIYFIKKEILSVQNNEPSDIDEVSLQPQQRIFDLENELKHSKENLQASIEELETTNEELQSTNEELISSNEELQSTNEELQSVNEELYTVNTEFQAKNHDLTVINNDMENLLQNSEIRVIFLDLNLKIRKFTDNITDIFNLRKNDNNRPLSDITHNIHGNDLFSKAQLVTQNKMEIDEIVNARSKWYQMKILPYVTQKGFIDGVVITFIDVTDFYISQQNLKLTEERFKTLFEFIPIGITITDRNGKIISSNKTSERMLGISQDEQTQRKIDGQEWQIIRKDGTVMPVYEYASVRAIRDNILVVGVEMGIVNSEGKTRWIIVNAMPTNLKDFEYAISYTDVTALVEQQFALQESEQKFKNIFDNSIIGFAIVNLAGDYTKINKAFEKFTDYSEKELLTLNFRDITHPEDIYEEDLLLQRIKNKEINSFNLKKRYVRKDAEIIWGMLTLTVIKSQNNEPLYYIAQIQNIDAEVRAKVKLDESRNLYYSVFQNMNQAFALHQIIYDKNNLPCDYLFLDINSAFEKITGFYKFNVIGRNVKNLIPDLEEKWIEIYGKVATTGESYSFEMFSDTMNRKFKVNAFSPKRGQFATIFDEVK